MIKLKPRNDWVIVRTVEVEKNKAGIVMPQTSIEGKRFIVEAVGEKVENLQPGDSVMLAGARDAQFFPVPKHQNLIAIKQENVVFVEVEVQE